MDGGILIITSRALRTPDNSSFGSGNARDWTFVDSVSWVCSNNLVLVNLNHHQFSWYVNPSCSSRSSRTHSFTVVDIITRVNSNNDVPSRRNPFQFSRYVDPLKSVQFTKTETFQILIKGYDICTKISTYYSDYSSCHPSDINIS